MVKLDPALYVVPVPAELVFHPPKTALFLVILFTLPGSVIISPPFAIRESGGVPDPPLLSKVRVYVSGLLGAVGLLEQLTMIPIKAIAIAQKNAGLFAPDNLLNNNLLIIKSSNQMFFSLFL